MSLAECQSKVSAREFGEWMARERMEPRGRERGDIQAALIASVIANANRGRRRGPYTIKDFLLRWNRKTKRQSVDDMRAIFRQYAELHNSLQKKAK